MNKLILILITLFLMFGCKEIRNTELIYNDDPNYFNEDEVDKQTKPKVKDFNFFLNKEFISLIKEVTDRNSNLNEFYLFKYVIYINKNGSVDKLQRIKIPRETQENFKSDITQEELNEEITQKLLLRIGDWEFSPAILDRQPVPMRKEIEASFVVIKSGVNNFDIMAVRPFEVSFNTFFVAVEQMPTPIGGIKSIQEKIRYPEIAKRAGIEGRVFVKAFINATGTVSRTEIIRGIGAGCDEAAMDAVKKTKFTPGMQRGKPVNVQVTVPILFKLQ